MTPGSSSSGRFSRSTCELESCAGSPSKETFVSGTLPKRSFFARTRVEDLYVGPALHPLAFSTSWTVTRPFAPLPETASISTPASSALRSAAARGIVLRGPLLPAPVAQLERLVGGREAQLLGLVGRGRADLVGDELCDMFRDLAAARSAAAGPAAAIAPFTAAAAPASECTERSGALAETADGLSGALAQLADGLAGAFADLANGLPRAATDVLDRAAGAFADILHRARRLPCRRP